MKAKELRQRAWNALKGRYWWAVLAALIASLFGAVSISVTSKAASESGDVANGTSDAVAKFDAYLNSLPESTVFIIIGILIAIMIVAIAMSILGGAVKLGYCRFNMDLFTEVEKPTMNLLFSRLGIIWKALWMEILIGLAVTVGIILFIVPGIVLALAYAQAEYILAENPDIKAVEAMKKSRMMMKGNKWSLFCLALSFLGWIILASIIPAGHLLLAPYMEAADAAFYLDRTGRLADGAKDLGEMEAKA